MEKKQKIAMKKGIVRGNCPGSIILGGNCPGAIVQGVVVRGAIVQEGIVLEPYFALY